MKKRVKYETKMRKRDSAAYPLNPRKVSALYDLLFCL
jgi:hypothetical protein